MNKFHIKFCGYYSFKQHLNSILPTNCRRLLTETFASFVTVLIIIADTDDDQSGLIMEPTASKSICQTRPVPCGNQVPSCCCSLSAPRLKVEGYLRLYYPGGQTQPGMHGVLGGQVRFNIRLRQVGAQATPPLCSVQLW